MRNGRKRNEEKEEFVPVKNKDYFEFKDGVYFTLEALCRKYDCQHTHIYRRRKEFDIPMQNVLSTTVIKDDERFAKLPKSNNLDGKQHDRLTSYATLHRTVQEAVDTMNEANKIHNDWGAVINNEISNLVYQVRDNNRLLTQVLDHLTKEKTNATTNNERIKD